jgi:MerR family transcriptional regulator, heat shock protein HspR
VDLEAVYVISVAARLLGMHPQTLRKYERAGLVRPSRSEGMLRMYSDDDVSRLRLIKHLVDDFGLNLAGVELVLRMRERLVSFRDVLADGRTVSPAALDQHLDELLMILEEREETP